MKKKKEKTLTVSLTMSATVSELEGNKEIGTANYRKQTSFFVPKKVWDKRWENAVRYLTTGNFIPKKKSSPKK